MTEEEIKDMLYRIEQLEKRVKELEDAISLAGLDEKLRKVRNTSPYDLSWRG